MSAAAKENMKRTMLYDGKAKTLFADDDNGTSVIQYFKDDATAFNAEKHAVLAGKGVLNNFISEHIMNHLGEHGIPTHFIERLNEREQRVRKVEIIMLEVVMRNIATGSLLKRNDKYKKGDRLEAPLLEYFYKNDAEGDPFITPDEAIAKGVASAEELTQIGKMARKINTLLIPLFRKAGLRLVDFKLEFGRAKDGTIILADEISPDSCRLWDENGQSKDKDVFREDLGNLVDAYYYVACRLGIKFGTRIYINNDMGNKTGEPA